MDKILFTFATKTPEGTKIEYTVWEAEDGSHSVDKLVQQPLDEKRYNELLLHFADAIDFQMPSEEE